MSRAFFSIRTGTLVCILVVTICISADADSVNRFCHLGLRVSREKEREDQEKGNRKKSKRKGTLWKKKAHTRAQKKKRERMRILDEEEEEEGSSDSSSSLDSSSRPKDDAKIADDCETVALGQKETTREELMSRLETELLKQKNVSLTHSLEEEEQSRQFRIQMAKLAAQGNMGLKEKGGEMAALSPEECGGKTEKYSWTQTETEIGIYVTLESFEVKGKDCKIEIKRRTLNVKVKDFIVFGEETKNNRLFADVNVDDSTWEIDSDEKLKAKTLIVTLTKAKRTMANKHWRYVCENEPEIDVEKFGPPVVGVNERNPMDTELLREMFEQMKNPSVD